MKYPVSFTWCSISADYTYLHAGVCGGPVALGGAGRGGALRVWWHGGRGPALAPLRQVQRPRLVWLDLERGPRLHLEGGSDRNLWFNVQRVGAEGTGVSEQELGGWRSDAHLRGWGSDGHADFWALEPLQVLLPVLGVTETRKVMKYAKFKYRPFTKTLARSRAFVNRISVRFYETNCTK